MTDSASSSGSPKVDVDVDVKPEKTKPDVKPEPRITNDSEGSTEQKTAVKRLSTYSKESRNRKGHRKTSADAEVAEDAAETTETPVEEPAQVGLPDVPMITTGNLLTLLGLMVASAAAILSYVFRPKAPPKAGPKGPDTCPAENPLLPSNTTPAPTPAKPAKPKPPRFKKL